MAHCVCDVAGVKGKEESSSDYSSKSPSPSTSARNDEAAAGPVPGMGSTGPARALETSAKLTAAVASQFHAANAFEKFLNFGVLPQV